MNLGLIIDFYFTTYCNILFIMTFRAIYLENKKKIHNKTLKKKKSLVISLLKLKRKSLAHLKRNLIKVF